MFEMLILLLVALATKHGRGRGKRRYSLRRVAVTPGIALGNLVTLIVVKGNVVGNADGAYRAISLKGTWSIEGHTAGEGPIVVGFAHDDYTVTEIKEALESAASISIGNKVENERARRLVRKVGTFSGQTTDETLNDGKPIHTRLNWAIPIGTNLAMFAYNDGSGQLTTGTEMRFNGNLWVKDY